MRIHHWARLSWWQKTRATALAFTAIAIGAVFILVIFLAGLGQTAAMGTLGWIALSAFPISIVFMIATLVRVQRRINLRSGGVRGGAAYSSGNDHGSIE